jgi:membrane-bound lytic murein transglycosylase D
MHGIGSRLLSAAILIALTFSNSPQPAHAAVETGPKSLHFPKPPLLEPNVEFWKQIYTEYGVGDFVLHDRDNLGVIYGVVRVGNTTDQGRAADLARSEIRRLRASNQDLLAKLAGGIPPKDLGPAGEAVWRIWGCPCSPDLLLRAADNIRVQQGLRQKVDEGIQRAQKLLPRILAILREHQIPPELAALPLVESSYNPRAYSKAGAAGLWQFIRSTGKQYLTISRKRDDRRDPLRATDAAAHLLRHNYEALGSWPLAIIAYNHGREGILAARSAVGSSAIEDIIARYTGPRFGFASKNFYAEFLAALEVFSPLLTGQGRPLEARGRQRDVPRAALAVARPAVPTAAPEAPAPAAPPMAAEPPIAVSLPPAVQALVEQPAVPEPLSDAPEVAAPLPGTTDTSPQDAPVPYAQEGDSAGIMVP